MSKEFALVTGSQTTNYIPFDDKHDLAINNICKETKESLSMKRLHYYVIKRWSITQYKKSKLEALHK